jgi:hypothetical protein
LSGEGGIRTRGELSPTQHFQCCTFGRSVTSPEKPNYLRNSDLRRIISGKSLAKTALAKSLAKFGSVSVNYATRSYSILARVKTIGDSLGDP